MTCVLLGRFPPMLHSVIVDALADRRDVTVIRREGTRARITRRHVDVVLIAAAAPEDPEGALPLLWRWPRSRVVMIARSGRYAVTYELVPRTLALVDVSRDRLIEAVCRPIGNDAGPR